MDRLIIRGGRPLEGRIRISGSKNASLPLMVASLLTDAPLILGNVPDLADIRTLEALLVGLGVACEDLPADGQGRTVHLRANALNGATAPYDLVRKMRASVLVLGPLVARTGEARVSLPGGCAIGPRPVDLHLSGLEQMGARIALDEGYIHATAPSGLKGATIRFPFVSVGATENLVLAATLADGVTILENAAQEPEIGDLARCLVAMGARISGIGTSRLVIEGVARLDGAHHAVLPDRIETGTHALAAAITGGEITLEATSAGLIGALISALEPSGVEVREADGSLVVRRTDGRVRGVDVMTEPYPGFPTDLQAQFMALMTVAEGASMVTETIFENRFMHVPELRRVGANITVHGSSALVRGVPRLRGAPVMATDLRASVSLVLAGLAAEGETVVRRIYHLDRGYERIEEKLAGCGADIRRERD